MGCGIIGRCKTYIDIKRQLVRQHNENKREPGTTIIRSGDKTSLVLKDVLKSEASYRRLYLPNFVAEYFRKIKNWQDEMKRDCGSGYNLLSFVFCSELGDVFDPRTYTEIFYRIGKALDRYVTISDDQILEVANNLNRL